MKVWRLTVHHIRRKEIQQQALAWTKRNKRIAVGWGYIGDLVAESLHSVEDIRDEIKDIYPTWETPRSGGVALQNFCGLWGLTPA